MTLKTRIASIRDLMDVPQEVAGLGDAAEAVSSALLATQTMLQDNKGKTRGRGNTQHPNPVNDVELFAVFHRINCVSPKSTDDAHKLVDLLTNRLSNMMKVSDVFPLTMNYRLIRMKCSSDVFWVSSPPQSIPLPP